ncbi:MAG: transcriptional repressor [Lachnospiraceae bacterium]
MLKYSKQRECIKTFLIGREDHPTADTVYMHVREEFPNISLGTVYRNLTLLSEIGEINRLRVGDGVDRYDADTTPHHHVICNTCGCVKDLEIPHLDHLLDVAAEGYDGVITSHTVHFYGNCAKCLEAMGN